MRSKGKPSIPFDFDATSKEIGERLKFARVSFHLSQAELGHMLGLSFQQIQKYELGITPITATRLIQFCRALKIDLDIILPVSRPLRRMPRSCATPFAKSAALNGSR
jgi:transcriptional regulator with XRE-family HTH domain